MPGAMWRPMWLYKKQPWMMPGYRGTLIWGRVCRMDGIECALIMALQGYCKVRQASLL